MINHIILWKNKFCWFISFELPVIMIYGREKILAAIQFWLPIHIILSRFLSSIYHIVILYVLHLQIENQKMKLIQTVSIHWKSHLCRIPIRIVNGDICVTLEHFFSALGPGWWWFEPWRFTGEDHQRISSTHYCRKSKR